MIDICEITPESHKSIYLIDYSMGFNGKNQKENIFSFRLTGVPPSQAIKRIQINPDHSIAEIKKTIQREYKLNPILTIQFIFKGKVLPENLIFSKIGIHPKKDIITIISSMLGAAHNKTRWK